jgi:hypothetical protein
VKPCAKCHDLYRIGKIRREMVMGVPDKAPPTSRYGGTDICRDCAAAEALMGVAHPDFAASRVATGTCRQESLRLPGAPIGLIQAGYMRASEPGDFDAHHDWLDEHVPWREGDGE